MSGRIRFTHPKVVRYILERNPEYVATMRNYPRRIGEWLTIDAGGTRLWGIVVACLEANNENIGKLVEFSGFTAPEEWLSEAKRLHGGRKPRYIILLKLVRYESTNHLNK